MNSRPEKTRKGFETETGELPSAQDFAEEVWDRQGCSARFPFLSLEDEPG